MAKHCPLGMAKGCSFVTAARTFAGAGLVSIDAKGRITLPSDIRDVLLATSPEHKVCVSLHDHLDCLVGFGTDEQARKMADIAFQWENAVKNDGDFDAEGAAVADYSLTFTANCEASGRFVLNPDLRAMAMIEDRAFIYGAGRNFCIWNPNVFLEAPLGDKYARLRRYLELQISKDGGRK